jgi:Ca-activated chloride channel family protein
LTDIQIKTPGFETYDVHPTHFPDLLAQRPIILFGKWRGPVTGAFELTGRSGRGDFVTRIDINGLQPDEGNRALRYLWARSRIAELSDYGSANVRSDQAKQITKLGLDYSLLTQYTSFIAVREVVTNTLGPGQDINQPLPLPIRVSDMAVGGTDQGSEPELIVLLIGSVLIASFMILRKRFASFGRRLS